MGTILDEKVSVGGSVMLLVVCVMLMGRMGVFGRNGCTSFL